MLPTEEAFRGAARSEYDKGIPRWLVDSVSTAGDSLPFPLGRKSGLG